MSAQPAAETVPPRLLIIDELGFVPLSRTGAELPELGTLGRKQIAAPGRSGTVQAGQWTPPRKA